MKTDAQLNLAMVGCGDIAGAYLDSAPKTRRCRIVQVMDVNLSLAEQRGKAQGVPSTSSYEEVLANPAVDAVILSVPHFLHAPMTIQALEKGKHVMCDKPIATTVADGKQMIATAKRTGRKLNINYAMRCGDKARFARHLIHEGLLGEIIAINITSASMKPEDYWSRGWAKVTQTDWRKSKTKSGGGVTLMNASHHIDLLFHLTGQSAVSVAGFAGTLNSPTGVEVEDCAVGALKLRNNGIMSVIASSCYAGGLTAHLSVLGKKGQIEMHTGTNQTLRVFLMDAGTRNIKTHAWEELPVPTSVTPGGYVDLLDEFAAAVLDDAPVPVDPQDALHTLACVLAIYGENSDLPPGYEDPSLPQPASLRE